MLSTFILWLPFLSKWDSIGHLVFNNPLSMFDIYKHWDGALYVIVAKTFYNPNNSVLASAPLGLPVNYFVAHFPLYPLLIKIGAFFVGYLKSMLAWPVLFAVLYGSFFYYFVKELKITKKPLLLVLVALFFTPRFFVIRSVPAPETIFMFLTLASVFFFIKKKYLLAGLVGAFAVFTRSPGMLLFTGYGLYFLTKVLKTKKIKLEWFGILLIPIALLLVFLLFYLQTGNFFAYFYSGDNIHLLFPPFQVFNHQATWVGTGWLEDIMFIYMFYFLALLNLWQKKELKPVFYFVLIYFLAIISVEHKDIARYSLPILPFALMAFERFFTSRKLLITVLVVLPALYFYAWNFMLHNVAPITEWGLFM